MALKPKCFEELDYRKTCTVSPDSNQHFDHFFATAKKKIECTDNAVPHHLQIDGISIGLF